MCAVIKSRNIENNFIFRRFKDCCMIVNKFELLDFKFNVPIWKTFRGFGIKEKLNAAD